MTCLFYHFQKLRQILSLWYDIFCTSVHKATMVYMKPERTLWSMKPKRAEKQHNSNIQWAKEREIQYLIG